MKKKIFAFTLILLSIFILTGCGKQNKEKEKEIIIDTKQKTEQIVSNMSKNGQLKQDAFAMYFMSFGRDLMLELEEQYNSGNKVFISYEDEEYNGKKVGKDNSDINKYYIYIGSETNNDLWTYGTIDLTTGNISWNDNY